ncbi:MAG: Gfo/Idh/MocA family oxidoreductase [Bacteroidales bacterium]|jgi:UDP-N-acetyl-2-amino-2-deoxyglucuronate dehydrogenase|nr:Gfo/Idh/MocA family oxidoreductase [Bacteroidales bacterium]MBQ4476796.1 Gfo/Idh/MocA family oxidoreductase [Bacteroidales bacterium]MBR3797432.1 Gfo/Idh/MocA family oxidoreductase [Bacteroidales bacterium]
MKNFAIIGVGGYIAPRHLKAIKETGNNLLVALDKSDSVGIMDSFFPKADFFTEPERFERHVYKLQHGSGEKLDIFSICTPNYLHDAHIRMALLNGADAICEKPLVLNPWNIDALSELEKETGHKIYNILQLRLHPAIIELKKKIEAGDPNKIYDVDLTYITSRGKWFHYSWKGDIAKSGGLATNIGIHFFDMLQYIFGKKKMLVVHHRDNHVVSGYLELEKARVRWFLSVDSEYLPDEIKAKGQTTYRSIQIAGDELEFTGGFTDLHTESYRNILAGNGFGLDQAKPSIEMVHFIRNAEVVTTMKDCEHPFISRIK